MKKLLLLTILSLFIISCADKAKEQNEITDMEQELAEDHSTSDPSENPDPSAEPISTTNNVVLKHGTITGSNVILRASPSTNSDKLDVLKGNGEKVTILEKLTAGNSTQAITKEELKITIGKESIILPKEKAVKITSQNEGSQTATITFTDATSKERTTDLAYKQLEFISDSDWYQVETKKAKIGWVFGKFITEGAAYTAKDLKLNSKRILTYSTPEDEEEYAEQGGEDWAYFTYNVEEYFKKKHPAVEFGEFFQSDLSTEERKRFEKKLDLEGFGYVLIDGERSHFIIHNMYDEVIADAVVFFGF